MSKEAVALASKLGDFFRIYLSKQKCYSENTITSYKYAFNLFFDFLSNEKGILMEKASLNCFSNEYVVAAYRTMQQRFHMQPAVDGFAFIWKIHRN